MDTARNNVSRLRKEGLVEDTGKKDGHAPELRLTESGIEYVEDYLKERISPKGRKETSSLSSPLIGVRDNDESPGDSLLEPNANDANEEVEEWFG
jgi:DNA-binding PadR family transcriptional regulator